MSVQALRGSSGGPFVRDSYTRTSGDYSTSGTSMQNIDGTNLVFTLVLTRPARVRCIQVCQITGSATNNQQIWNDLAVDGTRVGGSSDVEGLIAFRNANDTTIRRYNGSYEYTTDVLPAGSHTFAFMWSTASGTATIPSSGKPKWVVEEVADNIVGPRGARGPSGSPTPLTESSSRPAATDDEGAGYSVGHKWLYTPTKQMYVSVDDTDDAAVWKLVTEWDVFLVKASDQQVVNSTSLVDCTGMGFPVNNGEVWEYEMYLPYSAPAGDLQWRFTCPTCDLHVRMDWGENSANAAHDSVIREASITATTARVCGGSAATTLIRHSGSKGYFTMGASGTIQLQFAQSTLDASNPAIIRAGSYIKARRIV